MPSHPVDFPLETLSTWGVRFTPLGLDLPEQLPIEGWADIGRKLWRTDQVMQWWLGDWAAFGLRKYDQERRASAQSAPSEQSARPPMTLKEFAAANNINYGTLQNLSWVSQNVPISRRRENLEWSKHAEVAPLPPKDQVKWLDKMETEHLPRSVVRQQIRISQGENNALQPDGPITKFVTKGLDDLLAWLRARPDGFWDAEHRAIWRERLRPLIDFWKEL